MRLFQLLTQYLPYWIVLVGILGYLAPTPAALSDFLVPWLLFLLILGLGLTLNVRDFRSKLSWKEIFGLLLLQLIILPTTAILLSLAFPPGPLRDGIFVLGLVPAEITSPLMASMARGDAVLSAIFLILSMLVSLLIIPFVAGTHVAVSLAIELSFSVILPLAIGVIVRRWFWQPRRELCDALSVTAVLGLIFLACTALSTVGLLPLLLLVGLSLVIVVAGFGWGMLIGRCIGATHKRLISLIFFSGMREFGVAVAIAVSAFPYGAGIPAAIYGPIMIFVAGTTASFLKKRSAL